MGPLGRTLLVLSGGREAVAGIHAAKRLGLRVVVADRDPEAPARALSDEFLEADIYDATAVVEAVSRRAGPRIDGVLTIASDAVRAVAAVAETLGLRGPSPRTARAATDKLEMKECLRSRGVPLPAFCAVPSLEALRERMAEPAFAHSVLKPVDSRGARGVVRLDADSDLAWAFDHARRASPSGRLLLEQWLDGPQLSTECLVVAGRSHLCGAADRNYARAAETWPFVIEDGGETPSRLSPDVDEALCKLHDASAAALGLRDGVLKGDVVVHAGVPHVIEVAARLSGGFFSTLTIPLVYGIPLVELAVRQCLGLDLQPPAGARPRCFQANRFLFLPPGRVLDVRAPAPASFPPWVEHFELCVRAGDRIGPIENHTQRLGSVLVRGASREEAITRAESVIRSIRVKLAED